jgi:hypothetical protein
VEVALCPGARSDAEKLSCWAAATAAGSLAACQALQAQACSWSYTWDKTPRVTGITPAIGSAGTVVQVSPEPSPGATPPACLIAVDSTVHICCLPPATSFTSLPPPDLLQINGDNLDYVTSVVLTDGSASADAMVLWQGSTSMQVRAQGRAVLCGGSLVCMLVWFVCTLWFYSIHDDSVNGQLT